LSFFVIENIELAVTSTPNQLFFILFNEFSIGLVIWVKHSV
jgi:hypothetical protein